MKKAVFIDIETSGLDPEKDTIWQLAIATALQSDKCLKILEITEKLYTKKDKKKLKEFVENNIRNSDLLISHNILFELKFLDAYGINTSGIKKYCTMFESAEVCKIRSGFWDYKPPKLSEAFSMLALNKFNHLLYIDRSGHDAVYDLIMTIKVYAVLQNIEIDTSETEIYIEENEKILKHAKRYSVFYHSVITKEFYPGKKSKIIINGKVFNHQ